MGNVVNKVTHPIQAMRGKKRKREDEDSDSNEEINDLLDKSLATPKRKKLISTAKYIYQALFKEERNSDITVHALGKVWHLHKVYLSQSPYFASMFNGSWREADEDYIHIEIVDPKITIESLYSVFGSLYMDEVVLEPREIVSSLATATLFQLDSLIDRCAEVMIETSNAEVKRQFQIRVSVSSLNDLRQIKHQQTTPIQSVSLDKNEEAMLIMFDKELTYPLLISVNMLVVSPPRTSFPNSSATGGVQQGSPTAGPSSSSRQSHRQDEEESLDGAGGNNIVVSS